MSCQNICFHKYGLAVLFLFQIVMPVLHYGWTLSIPCRTSYQLQALVNVFYKRGFRLYLAYL